MTDDIRCITIPWLKGGVKVLSYFTPHIIPYIFIYISHNFYQVGLWHPKPIANCLTWPRIELSHGKSETSGEVMDSWPGG